MNLLRHGPLGQEKPGALDASGRVRDLGLAAKPSPVFLRRGDVMTLDAGPLGTQRQRVV